MNENWKPVVGWDLIYEVSDLGRLRRVGAIKPVSMCINPFGYVQTMLCDKKRRKTVRVHAIVLGAFVGPRPEGLAINHINGVKTDNRLCNIEYATHKENTRHSIETLGNSRSGESHYAARLTVNDVMSIRDSYSSGEPTNSIAIRFGVTTRAIHAIAGCHTWKCLGLAPIRRKHGRPSQITNENITRVLAAVESGKKQNEVAKSIGVHPSVVSRIVNRKRQFQNSCA